MNGRIYDPQLGRMLQADPFVQAPGNTQSYNRYSYVQNNPLRYTDPSGYNWKDWVAPVVAVAAIVACNGYVHCGIEAYMAIGATSGGASAAANGGDIVQGAIVGGISGAAFYGVGEAVGSGITPNEIALRVVGYGAVGGVASMFSGGEFHHGFISAGAGALIPGGLGGSSYEMMALRTIGRAIIGGTISKLTGDKFANGAATAAFVSLMSEAARSAATDDASEGGVTYTERKSREAEKALMVEADTIADGLGAPGGDVPWEYSGAESINCGGTTTYACTTTKTYTDYRGDKTYSHSIEYGYGSASPGTHNIAWRGGGLLLTFKTGLERAVFVTLHERAHTTLLPGAANAEVRANLKAMDYYEKWRQ